MEECAKNLGLPYSWQANNNSCKLLSFRKGLSTEVKFLNWCRPAKKRAIQKRITKRSSFFRKDKIVSVIPDGEGEVFGMTTSTGNYVAWGYASKNCGKNGFVFPSFYGSFWAQIAPKMWEMIADKNLNVDGVSLYEILKEKGITELGSCDPDNQDEGTFAAHVRAIEKDFWGRRFRVYAQWKRDWWEAYQRDLGFRYLTGFYVYGAGYKKNDITNYPIQGSAFHCLLWVLIKLVAWLRKNKMKSKVVGQIHDSIIGDVYKPELQDYLNKVRELVTVDLPKAFDWICVPMTIEAEVASETWDSKSEWVLRNGIWGSMK